MNWYYANSGRQTGPVAEDAFQQLVTQGTVRGDTLVWHEGMPQWIPYNSVNGPAAQSAVTQSTAAGMRYCAQCGSAYSPDDLVSFGGVLVCGSCKPAYLQRLREGVLPAGRLDFAGIWVRFGAYLLDVVILSFAAILFGTIPVVIFQPGMRNLVAILTGALFTLFLLIVPLGYETYFVGKYGATPGKLACHIAVVRTDGAKLTYGRAFGRYGAKIVNGFTMGIGYLIACFDEEKAALHDRIADTRVIRR